ncbi:inorganic phosphate transporter family protein [bacterium]|nr:inorganic phosphate transporter family protein [bacterium]
MWRIVSGIFMGWSLGSNDAANIFGTGVTSKLIRFRTAIILLSIFVVAGALLEGPKCMHSLKTLGTLSVNQAFICTLAAALTMTILTFMSIPASTSQAIVGAIIGATIVSCQPNWLQFGKMLLCWILTPFGAAVIAYILYKLFDWLISGRIRSTRGLQRFLQVTMIIAGCYGSYALGANNVANTTGVYVNSNLLSPFAGSLIGALSIIIGAATYSRRVMETVGNRITIIGPQGAVIATLSHSITIHIYTQIGIPVSSSQAIVGAVAGIGFIRGIKALNRKVMRQIFLGWLFTPIIAALVAFIGASILNNGNYLISLFQQTWSYLR